MSAITAAAVKELREITGVAMMDCKKALVECNGDLEEAKEFLRKKGQAKALKKSSRETREGAVGIRFNGFCGKKRFVSGTSTIPWRTGTLPRFRVFT